MILPWWTLLLAGTWGRQLRRSRVIGDSAGPASEWSRPGR